MSKTEFVDIHFDDFNKVKDFKIFNLENFKKLEERIPLVDAYSRRTIIYA
jgi:hypothetical protein